MESENIIEDFCGAYANVLFQKDFLERYQYSHDRHLVWECKNGNKIKLKDMTDSHLNNAIKYLERKGSTHESSLDILKREKRYREDYPKILRRLSEFKQVVDTCL